MILGSTKWGSKSILSITNLLPLNQVEAVGLVHQFESTRTFGEYPLESDLSDNISIAKLNVEVKETVGRRVKKLIVKSYQ